MKEKYALLDTDYISKTHMIRKDDHNLRCCKMGILDTR